MAQLYAYGRTELCLTSDESPFTIHERKIECRLQIRILKITLSLTLTTYYTIESIVNNE